MLAINRFLGNWSPYLKCYGLVMIRVKYLLNLFSLIKNHGFYF